MTANITEDHCNNKFKTDNTFSVIHFSSRSLYANFDHIKSCLKQFTKPFTVILISETWSFLLKVMSLYVWIGQKKHGGVAMNVDSNCKKKNSLYKRFLKSRTKKLLKINIRSIKTNWQVSFSKCKQDYYNKILENNWNNIKGLKNILNNIIRNKSRTINYPQQ